MKRQVILHYADDETLEIFVGDVSVGHANHDEHGWAGMNAVENLARGMAKEFGMEVLET